MNDWRPKEIILHEKVKNDPDAQFFISQCPGVPVKETRSGKGPDIVKESSILSSAGPSILQTIQAGKSVVYLAHAGSSVDQFVMPDSRMVCPHFDRLKLASNGCYFQCDWCYLKLTYRAVFPFISIHCEYDKIKKQIQNRLKRFTKPVIFNSGEMADSLALEHLTRAGREFIPWFGQTKSGYLYMLTKSDNVDPILDLDHSGRTILTWSINNDHISRKFEIGAPTFDRRIEAARKVQAAGYPLRLRLDPIVPYPEWQDGYSKTIKRIFEILSPERITLGTLRFEENFYRMRKNIFSTGSELAPYLEEMKPMFPPMEVTNQKRPKVGKYSFSEEKRTDIFRFAIDEIRKYSDCTIALCKESAAVWNQTGLPLSKCACVCKLEYVDMSK